MSTTAIVTMICICTVVWGGFILLLTRAVWRERRKQAAAGPEDEATPGGS